ncbi:MAG: peptidylprolyl isomerase [Candidatus Marinimicrobia bacterium]|nr:peptidylprolyl isomerase [Candidatus Neomarinimicrobiota bacterium]
MLFLLNLIVSCDKGALSNNIIAEVEDEQISVDDFKRAYLPMLLYSDKKESLQTREEILSFLIDQTLLAREARSLQLDTIPTMAVLKRTAQKTAFTRILYKEWVKALIPTASETELRTAFQRSHNPRLVRHLFTESKSEADRLYQQLMNGADWNELAASSFNESSLAENGGVLGWIKFGDMDSDFESAVYDLQIMEISTPVVTKFGWHIIRVDEQSREIMLTEYDYSLARSQLKRIIRERHEQRLADSVVNGLMSSANLIFHPEIAPQVWTVMRDQVRGLLNSDEMSELDNSEMRDFRNKLDPILHAEMLRFSGTIWTVKDFLERLPEMNRQMMLTNLKSATAFLVRDEIIYQEGLKKNLDKSPEVKGEIRDRENQFLANLFLRFKANSQTLSDEAIQEHYRQYGNSRYLAPDSIYITEYIFNNPEQALRAKELLKAAPSSALSSSDLKFSINPLGWFQGSRPDRADYYHRLVNQALNTPTGPLKNADGFVLIMATKRHRHAKALEQIYDTVRLDAEEDQLGKLRLREVQKLSENKKIRIDLEKLQSLSLKD